MLCPKDLTNTLQTCFKFGGIFIACKSIILFEQIRTIDKRRLREYMGTLDKRFLLAMDKALAISIGLNRYLHCPMKQGRLSVSLPAHECCPLHDDSVQKKD